ncbi:unnamed protein product [Staurois parvus]|uniref:Uncharacterized protein n=1 Tax=Staurois parvus TaxID=386267 RepID=A0ABN9BB01_9NEOB|nr:unnamed protein product [Staurois parvus]
MPLESAGEEKIILSVSNDMQMSAVDLRITDTLHSFGSHGPKPVWSHSVAVEAAAMEAIQHPYGQNGTSPTV